MKIGGVDGAWFEAAFTGKDENDIRLRDTLRKRRKRLERERKLRPLKKITGVVASGVGGLMEAGADVAMSYAQMKLMESMIKAENVHNNGAQADGADRPRSVLDGAQKGAYVERLGTNPYSVQQQFFPEARGYEHVGPALERETQRNRVSPVDKLGMRGFSDSGESTRRSSDGSVEYG